MNGYPLAETLVVALLVGSSAWYVAHAAWRGIRAAGDTRRTSACGACNGCSKARD